MFAAAVPICGGGDETRAESIAKVPVWVFHGGQDSVVQTACLRNMVAALKNAGGTPKYTEYPGVGHDSWTHAFKEPELLPWLFAQKRWRRLASFRPMFSLRMDFVAPPDAAKAWCYWWWLNGAASKEGITRDFQEMKKQGIAGALLFDAGEAGPDAPRGPKFMSPAVARTSTNTPSARQPLGHCAQREPVQRLERRRPVGDCRAGREETRRRLDRRQGAGPRQRQPAATGDDRGLLSRYRRVGAARRQRADSRNRSLAAGSSRRSAIAAGPST